MPWVDGHLLVVAHSAGGLVVAYGATRLDIPKRARTGPALYVMTVAAALAGMDDHPPNPGARPKPASCSTSETHMTEYPVAPMSMASVHLRTQYPGDQVMKPTAQHAPNDPKVGIPGARQIDLPARLTHGGARKYVAEKIADGTWRAWFDDGENLVRSNLLKVGDQIGSKARVGHFEVDQHRSHQSNLLRR